MKEKKKKVLFGAFAQPFSLSLSRRPHSVNLNTGDRAPSLAFDTEPPKFKNPRRNSVVLSLLSFTLIPFIHTHTHVYICMFIVPNQTDGLTIGNYFGYST